MKLSTTAAKQLKLAGPQLDRTVRQLFPELCQNPLGVQLEARHAKEASSEDQRCGWHWLLGEWTELDPGILKTIPHTIRGPNIKERFKTMVLVAKFGAVELTDKHGNRVLKPVQRTTQVWDWDLMDYRRKKLSKKLYTELVDFTYQKAAEDGTHLPDMDPRYKQELAA